MNTSQNSDYTETTTVYITSTYIYTSSSYTPVIPEYTVPVIHQVTADYFTVTSESKNNMLMEFSVDKGAWIEITVGYWLQNEEGENTDWISTGYTLQAANDEDLIDITIPIYPTSDIINVFIKDTSSGNAKLLNVYYFDS